MYTYILHTQLMHIDRAYVLLYKYTRYTLKVYIECNFCNNDSKFMEPTSKCFINPLLVLIFLFGSVAWDNMKLHSPESSTFFSWSEIEGHLEQLAVVITLALAVNLETTPSTQEKRHNQSLRYIVTRSSWLLKIAKL